MNKSIADLVPELEAGEPESLDTFIINHSRESGSCSLRRRRRWPS
jgi:hypothetical protein